MLPLWVLEVIWARLSLSPAPGAQLCPSHCLHLSSSGQVLLLLLLLGGQLFFLPCVTPLTTTPCEHLSCISGCWSLTSSVRVGIGAELCLRPEFLMGFFLFHIVLFCSLLLMKAELTLEWKFLVPWHFQCVSYLKVPKCKTLLGWDQNPKTHFPAGPLQSQTHLCSTLPLAYSSPYEVVQIEQSYPSLEK